MNDMGFYKTLSKEQLIERLIAQDVHNILLAAEDGDYEYLAEILDGIYSNFNSEALLEEYEEREDRIEQLIEDGDLPYDVD